MEKSMILKKYFGYDFFREGQESVIDSILEKKDVLGIMPTGAGKSICFQVPSIMFNGITLVISPLISLMKDQVDALIQSGVPAAYINSTLSFNQINKALYNAKKGKYKIIYVAPERLLSSSFLDFATSVEISMITIDEAHCISQWGQDFRPSYSEIPLFLERLNSRPVISAFTATATKKVKEDIITLLKLNNPFTLVTGFNRENLYFEVQHTKNKMESLFNLLISRKNKSGIIYCTSRANVEEVCEILNHNGYNATRYHAGLSDEERYKNQEDFLFDRVEIMVATNAFGMGIDKSNVSFVIHFNMPKDIESYYQEAGRAGRDGSEAQCIMLYSKKDVRTNQWLIENGRDTSNIDEETLQMLKKRDYQRLKHITFYSTTANCFRGFMLKYFGENPKDFCGNCSNCLNNSDFIDITIESQKILSCIARAKEKAEKEVIIHILTGTKSENVIKNNFQQLSTFGIWDKSEEELLNIISFLVKEKIIENNLTLLPSAKEVLKGEKKLKLPVPQKPIISYPKKKTINNELFLQLKETRLQVANQNGVPAFVIFSDATLREMAEKVPTTPREFMKISGVGEVKVEKYSETFLRVLRNYNH